MSTDLNRRAKRFRTTIALDVACNGERWVLTPEEISSTGCGFILDPPARLSGSCVVTIPITPILVIDQALITTRQHTRGFGISWSLQFEDAARLTASLAALNTEPSVDAKTDFLARENEVIHAELRSLEEQRRHGFQILLALIAGFFTYTVAPYKLFEVMTVEMVGFYALAGLWIAVIAVYQCMRFLHFLGEGIRRKTLLYRAFAVNRGWVFFNDQEYYARSILPLSSRYDDGRAQSSSEQHAQWVTYNSSTTWFMLFLQSFFILGLLHYLGILLRVYDLRVLEGVRVLPVGVGGALDLFKIEYFRASITAFVLVPVVWIQLMANRCAKYQKCIWEARRISPARPSPRFPDYAFKNQHKILYVAGRVLVAIIVVYAVTALGLVHRGLRSIDNVWMHVLFGPEATLLVATLLFIGKRQYNASVMRAAKKGDVAGGTVRASVEVA